MQYGPSVQHWGRHELAPWAHMAGMEENIVLAVHNSVGHELLFFVWEVYDMNVTVAVFPPFSREHQRSHVSKEGGVAPASWVSDLSVILSRWQQIW